MEIIKGKYIRYYDVSPEEGLNDDQIQERIIGGNYDSYYGTGYTRELYESDYEYGGNNQLEAYITYKITIRNCNGEYTIVRWG